MDPLDPSVANPINPVTGQPDPAYVAPEPPASEPVEQTSPAPADAPAVPDVPGAIALPNGWAVLVDASTLRNKDRNAILDSLDSAEASTPFRRGVALTEALIMRLVSEWSFDLPITHEGLGDMEVADYDALSAALGAARKVLFPDFSPTPAPDSPTAPSSE